MTLECPECNKSLENLYVGSEKAQIALHCPGCDKKWLVCEVLGEPFLMELRNTKKVPEIHIALSEAKRIV